MPGREILFVLAPHFAQMQVPNATHKLEEVIHACESSRRRAAPARRHRRMQPLGARVTFPVNSCNSYISRSHPTIREMEDVAWVLRSDPRRNEVGFVKASAPKPQERYVLPDAWD